MDGYTAYGASITRDGNKREPFDCPAPLGMVFDPAIAAAAPPRSPATSRVCRSDRQDSPPGPTGCWPTPWGRGDGRFRLLARGTDCRGVVRSDGRACGRRREGRPAGRRASAERFRHAGRAVETVRPPGPSISSAICGTWSTCASEERRFSHGFKGRNRHARLDGLS